ncbi:MAG TPA: hypothetical protein VMH39_12065 [Gemmatimonadaceae bacterium]|nr:hypothetical protein [Gemmatimonadaceae bacterium]
MPLAGFAAVIFPVSALLSQGSPPPTFSVAAGLSTATGTFGSRVNAGYALGASAAFPQPGGAFAVRLEAAYSSFANTDVTGNTQITSLDVDAVFGPSNATSRPATGSPQSGPFLIAGVGLYNVSEPDPIYVQNDYSNDIGFNIGGGYRFELSGFTAYLEARYHTVSNTDYRFVPIMFGVTF